MLVEFLCFLVAVLVLSSLYQHRKSAALRNALSPIGTVPYFNWPVVGNGASLLFARPWEQLSTWIDEYGGPRHLLRFTLMGQHFMVLGDVQLIQHVLGSAARNYPKDRTTFRPFMDLLGQGLVTSEGDGWAKQRRLLAPAFRGHGLQHVASAAWAASERLCSQISKKIGRSGAAVEWNSEFRSMTLQVIAYSIMSLSPEESDQILPRLYLPIVDEANKRVWVPWRRLIPNGEYHHAVSQLNEFVETIIKNRWRERATRSSMARQGALQLDILDRLLFAMFHQDQLEALEDATPSAGSSTGPTEAEEEDRASQGFNISETEAAAQQCPEWATSQLRDEIKTFLLAGHETSSLMLTWALYEVTQNPEVEERILQEALSVFPADQGNCQNEMEMPAYKDFRGLTYTEAVLKEALRKYSVVPVVTREAVKTEEVDGVTIPAGCTLVIPIRYVHYRPDLWEDPEKFNPNRWLQQRINAWHFLAFLQGPRFCIGQQFALLEGKIVLAMLVRRFKITACRDTNALPHRFMIPVPPSIGMTLFVQPRS